MSTRLRNSRISILIAVLLAPALPAAASLVLALELPQLVRDADHVVVAEALRVTSQWDASRERIHTQVELRVHESWKGKLSAGGRLMVVHPGGTVDGIGMRVLGAPRFAVGERSVLFVKGTETRATLVGMAQGKRTLRREGGDGRWIADSSDGGAATVAPDATGRLRPAPVDAPRTLDDLRAAVLMLVRR